MGSVRRVDVGGFLLTPFFILEKVPGSCEEIAFLPLRRCGGEILDDFFTGS
jgi:hypothetical protein